MLLYSYSKGENEDEFRGMHHICGGKKLNTVGIISCIVAAAVAFGSLVVCVCNLGIKFGRLEQRVDTTEDRATEDREKDRLNFAELFAFRNDQNALSREINTKLDNLTVQFEKLLRRQEK
jgi:hypothetical protein